MGGMRGIDAIEAIDAIETIDAIEGDGGDGRGWRTKTRSHCSRMLVITKEMINFAT